MQIGIHAGNHNNQTNHQQNNTRERKQRFKIHGSSEIKYGRYKMPIVPITKGMEAKVSFDKSTAVLTIIKGTTTIVINLKNETVTVNGVTDTNSGIFNAKNNKKMTVLIKYIAYLLGEKVDFDDDEIIVVVPGLNQPTNVTVTPVGTTVIANTLNNTTIFMTATAKIIAGQAVGGRAELYVGSKLVAIDSSIAATDTEVTFTTADASPTNAELQAIIPAGGLVTVRLYNASNNYTVSSVANPTLNVDYIAPTITGITSAIYNAAGNQLTLMVNGAGVIGDTVDVTKISFYDYSLGKTYQLTNYPGVGSYGVVKSSNSLVINIGSVDKAGLAGFVNTTMTLVVSPGSLLRDVVGNVSLAFTSMQTIPVTVSSTGLDLPTNVNITPIGTIVKTNTLNSTSLYLMASANIAVGQAVGGKAELYIDFRLIATDSYIGSTDNTVTFTTGDSTPTNTELQVAIPIGGIVTVRLYNASNYYVTSAIGNPTLVVDYVNPSITGISSGIYDVAKKQLYLFATGAGKVGDMIDVTKISLYDSTLGKTYQLTNASGIGSNGVVYNENTLLINIGDVDTMVLKNFGGSTVFLTISSGSLLSDLAGNTSTWFSTTLTVPVIVVK